MNPVKGKDGKDATLDVVVQVHLPVTLKSAATATAAAGGMKKAAAGAGIGGGGASSATHAAEMARSQAAENLEQLQNVASKGAR